MGSGSKPPARVVPYIFELARARDRLPISEIGDRIITANRKPGFIPPSRRRERQKSRLATMAKRDRGEM
jgi:hypothetical protein